MKVEIRKDSRCKHCGKKLGSDLEGEIKIVCPRCGVYNYFKTKNGEGG